MDTVLGVEYDGGVILACDQSNAKSILLYQTNIDKIIPLTSHSCLAVSGPPCDASNFTEYIAKNLQLYELAHHQSHPLSLHAQAHFARNELATALRKGPFQVNCLLGGVDIHHNSTSDNNNNNNDNKNAKPSLYFMDYLASLQKVKYGAQGYASYFCLSIFDKESKLLTNDTTEQDAIDMIKKCIHELQKRFLISQPNFLIKAIDQKGVRIVSYGSNPADN